MVHLVYIMALGERRSVYRLGIRVMSVTPVVMAINAHLATLVRVCVTERVQCENDTT